MELIESGKFYYHNALRITAPPPVSYIADDGTIVWLRQPNFYIEMKKSFTDKDLLGYYQEAFDVEVTHPDDIKRFTNALSYMANRHGLDTVLFTIDYYRDLIQSENVMPPSVPFDIQRYLPHGQETLENKKAREKGEGIGVSQSS